MAHVVIYSITGEGFSVRTIHFLVSFAVKFCDSNGRSIINLESGSTWLSL